MSSNFSWFLRFIIYIPLMICILFLSSYFYLTSKIETNIAECLSDKSIIPPTVKDRRKIVPFVGCLKKKNNFFLTTMMDENRLYQYAYPKLPCAFVGKWHVSENMHQYWLTINPDSTFFIKTIPYGKDEISSSRPLRTGVWSSASPNIVIQFFDDSLFWPINQSSVDWVSKNYFLMQNGIDQTLYFNRHSILDDGCAFKL